jgi:hypothetical protein
MLTRFFARLFPGLQASARFGTSPSAVNERNVTAGIDWNAVYRDRYNYQRDTVLQESLLAWRLNPLARRLVALTRQYVVDQVEAKCEHQGTSTFLQRLWNHPLNMIGERLGAWSDELSITGNLFLILTTDRAGMSYVRIYPTDQIKAIVTADNDIEQETGYIPKGSVLDIDPKPIPNAFKKPQAKTVMLHFSVNRLGGMKWGEPDLAPLLPWLARYASWIEDRVRLNRFRQAFLYVVKGKWLNEADRKARQNELNANPPNPGSVMVTDESEEWSTIDPKLDSFEANNDGLTLKKFIAGGQGIPLHWLSEPESSTRTTAEAAGTPSFKTLEERQGVFLAIVRSLLMVCVARRAARGDQSLDPLAEINVTAGDVSERDNAALALASSQVIQAFGGMWVAGLITPDEFMRVVYRFAGEQLPKEKSPSPDPAKFPVAGSNQGGIHVDAGTGKVSTSN